MEPYPTDPMGMAVEQIPQPARKLAAGCYVALVLAVVGAMALCVGLIALFPLSFRSSEPARLALERAQHDPDVIALVGTPVKLGWWVSGSMSSNAEGQFADLKLPISGPQGAATLYITARKQEGTWHFSQYRVETAPSGGGWAGLFRSPIFGVLLAIFGFIGVRELLSRRAWAALAAETGLRPVAIPFDLFSFLIGRRARELRGLYHGHEFIVTRYNAPSPTRHHGRTSMTTYTAVQAAFGGLTDVRVAILPGAGAPPAGAPWATDPLARRLRFVEQQPAGMVMALLAVPQVREGLSQLHSFNNIVMADGRVRYEQYGVPTRSAYLHRVMDLVADLGETAERYQD